MPPWLGPMLRPPGSLNHYRAELRRRDASQRASLAIIVGELSVARARLQAAIRQLEQGRLV